MNAVACRFSFEPTVALGDAEMSLHLAMFAVEGLIGRVPVRLDARYQLDQPGHAIVVDTGKAAGRMIVRVFTGLLLREFGEDAFCVHPENSLTSHREQERTVPA